MIRWPFRALGGERGKSRISLILLIVSAIFLATFLLLFKHASDRFRLLFDDIRENAVWSVYQLDREARTLGYVLSEQRRAERPNAEALATVALRFDILYSRNTVVQDSRFGSYFTADPAIGRHLAAINAQIRAIEPVFTTIAAGQWPSTDTLEVLDGRLTLLNRDTEALLVRTNIAVADERTHIRATMIDLEKTSALMLALLLLSVTFLVLTLRNQLKSQRESSDRLKRMTQELSGAYEAADAGNRAKSQFMATMGHEIRTPLNAILGMAELLEYSDLPEDAMGSVKTIRSSGEALLEIINEVLDYSKIEHGKLEVEERAVDIGGLIETAISIVSRRAADQQNELVVDIPAGLDTLCVRTDPTRLRQVLLNLLSNAVKFTHQGTVTLRLREFYRGSAMMLRFEVEDTGIGIDDSGLAKLFKPFSQVDASISRRYGGTGLGLTICKQIVEKLGGDLGMSSTVGVGSIFWFELPVVAARPEDVGAKSAGREPQAAIPRMKILLVEDNLVNQLVASRFLTKLGQEVVVARDGAEAVDFTEADTFDLILMDMQMPVMDGIEATKTIIARGGASALTPIVAMTANASDDDRRRCLAAGMVGFESKPVTLARLREVILGFVPQAQAADRARDPDGGGSDGRDADKSGQRPETALSPSTLPEAAADSAGLDLPDVSPLPSPLPSPAPVTAVARSGPELTLEQHLHDMHGLDESRYEELVDALGEDVYQELIESFFDDATLLLTQLQTAISLGDGRGVDRLLHTIKGAASNVGLSEIAVLAHALRQEPLSSDALRSLSVQIESAKMTLVA